MSWPSRGDDTKDERMEYRHPLYENADESEHCRQCEYNGICDYAPLREELCEAYGLCALYVTVPGTGASGGCSSRG